MTLTLILTRHAKSSWSGPALGDHARPLNGRGRRSAEAIGRWLKQKGYVPDQLLCSSSARTRETWALMGLHARDKQFLDDLYHASAAQMCQVLNTATCPTVLMLGHNPGIAAFATDLVATPPPHPRFADYPTGATTVMTFKTPRWADVAPQSGQTLDFVVPRDLI